MPDPAMHTDSRQGEMLDRIDALLDQVIRPDLRVDGTEVEVVGIDADHIVPIRLRGACRGCPSATIALAMGIEATLKSQIPSIRFLEAVP